MSSKLGRGSGHPSRRARHSFGLILGRIPTTKSRMLYLEFQTVIADDDVVRIKGGFQLGVGHPP